MKLNEQRLIYKIESKELKKAKWKYALDLETALKENPETVISLGESQLIRWIDKLRGKDNANENIRNIKNQINKIRNSAETSKTKSRLKKLYNRLYQLKFTPDLVAVVFPANKKSKDYDRANKGFSINGVNYRRLLGTAGGIKNCTIFYISENLHAELMQRIENGRNTEKELVAAKLEAYRALTCSGSVPIPAPDGVIVVKDCITKFKENVIVIRDSEDAPEPVLTNETDFEIKHNNSDGFGLMLPSYAAKVNEYLSNDSNPLSGMVIRYAFTKGALITFDFREFANTVANSYIITDVWGTPRDLRNAEIILTESQLKLWDSYNSWEDFEKCCKSNNYEWAVTKPCPMELENVHTTNYQFLQPFDFTDEEIKEMCSPTINEIKDVLGLDYRKSVAYLAGEHLTGESWDKIDDLVVKALLINPHTIDDPFVKSRILKNISKKIDRTKKGKIAINANYAMICGDPFALCQSIFGLEITGLLKAGEVYHKYWIDKGAEEIACFRAPMIACNNIKKLKLTKSETAADWFRYIKTACILNAFDSTAEACAGADFDGDTFYCTNEPIILANTKALPTIISIQGKAPKTIPTEADVIAANKLAFNDKIGQITNCVTAMYDVRAKFPKDSAEYAELTYRIACGLHAQQGEIDRAKGATVKEMPPYWKQLKPDGEYTELQKAIVANKKPYFFRYVYDSDNKSYIKHCKSYEESALKVLRMNFEDLADSDNPQAAEFLTQFENKSPLTDNGCTVNRIAHFIEKEMADFNDEIADTDYDYSILKSETPYTKNKYNLVSEVYKEYQKDCAEFMCGLKYRQNDKAEIDEHRGILIDTFRKKCAMICPNEDELTNILIDMVYSQKGKSKSFAWLICGDAIIKNLLTKNNNIINIPIKTNDGEFVFNGNEFLMKETKVNDDVKEDNDTK